MDFFSQEALYYLANFIKGDSPTYTDKLMLILILMLLFSMLFFLIPVLIAFFRKHKNILAISIMCAVPFIACIFMLLGVGGIAVKENATGYAFLVWAIALIWSVAKPLTIEIKSNESKNIKANKENKKTEE